MNEAVRILIGDTIEQMATLPAGCVHCCVTSPPYWGLRDYGVDGQIGLEPTPEEFVAKMVEVFSGVRRVLRDEGTLWLNLGDCYAGSGRGGYAGDKSTLEGYTGSQDQARFAKSTLNGRPIGQDSSRSAREKMGSQKGAIGRAWVPPPDGLKNKDLCMMPWRVAMALQADGWWLRSVICWAKKSPMPESCTDRPTSSWEPIFLMAKSERYFYDAEAVKEGIAESTKADRVDTGKNRLDRGFPGNPSAGGGRLGDAPTRNHRNVWHLGPEPYAEAHFATFPTEIPRRAIKAGTSEKGCCPACGTPWERMTAKTFEQTQNGVRSDAKGLNGMDRRGEYPRGRVHRATTGWQPTCDCGRPDVVPCLVLDPFLGSGTTIAVARQLGRHGVGCELNPKYAELARARIGRAERPETFRDLNKEDGPLFMEQSA